MTQTPMRISLRICILFVFSLVACQAVGTDGDWELVELNQGTFSNISFTGVDNSGAFDSQLQLDSAAGNITLNWVGCGITKKAFMAELSSAYTKRTGVTIDLAGGGATLGIRAPSALNADMGGSCRHVLPVDEESNAMLVPVAWDAMVAIVHPNNPIDEITLEQMKAILIGEIKNWQDVGGPDQKIHLVIREGKISGVGMMTRELIFKDREVDFTEDSTVVGSTGPLEEIVESDTWAFGISGISSARRREVKILALDGIVPSYENIAAGNYTLFRPLYLVIPKETENRWVVEDFIAFALSDEGQRIVKQAGTVNLEDGSALWRPYRENMLNAGVQMGEY